MSATRTGKLPKGLLIPSLIALLGVSLFGLGGAQASAAEAATDFPIPALSETSKTSPMPNVIVIATGGTIAGQVADGDPTNLQNYRAGTYKMEDMVAQLPRKDKIADVSTYQFGNKGSGGYLITELYDLSLAVDQALKTYDGVVVTTGTDTMEDIAYFLDLTVRSEKPVVVTGAMRPWDAIGTDAPANLYNAIKLAASGKTKSFGTVLMLNDVIQTARDVTKSNSHRMDTFESPILGALGYIDQDNISLYRANERALKAGRPEWGTPFDLTAISKDDLPLVEIAYAYQEADGGAIKGFVADGAKGIVTAGTGAGGISAKMGAARTEAIKQGVVFVTTTRTGSGTMYPGSTEGIIAGDSLNAQHARMLLLLSLAFSKDLPTIEQWFEEYGRQDISQEDIGVVSKLTDIEGHWANSSIKKGISRGIVSGYSDYSYKPDQNLTRAEFVVMLMKALKPAGTLAELSFADADQIGKWAELPVAQAVGAGIVNGYSDGTFDPSGPISRAEMTLMIAKAMKYELAKDAQPGFADDAAIPAWAKGAAKAVKDAGIMKGRSGGSFAPASYVSRAEAITAIVKLPVK
ncbi:asparaginase domain-containing protein [Cohnella herbarum]|uniref:asparaginase n=1 Tax=Cohnella herbarum TaxID=2728023 RepID=A0A7Z2VMY3_9BACL|nr:asparaginase domain-containing protein [Cohnella herbarum]QJD86022.1 hypothetical protein HH215_24505 [Cohnella herbarum]